MTEELKTLNELKVTSEHPMFNIGASTQARILKDEAIKWIKELMKDESICWEEGFHQFADFRHDTSPIIDFLKDRFNIKESDMHEF